MIHKSEIKLITSLQQKKYRMQHGLFVAEGIKLVKDLLSSGSEPVHIFTSEDTSLGHPLCQLISTKELQKISSQKNASGVLGVFRIPEQSAPSPSGLTVALDAVRDPGNMGTIIRLCDWFGVSQLICSDDTVDCYNPKVVQATMGSIARVQVHYVALNEFLAESSSPIYAAVMNGNNIYAEALPENAILLMGNEARGISENLLQQISNPITIPSFSQGDTAESLNVAMATGILLSEFRRNIIER